MITIRFAPRFILPFGVAYGFMWALSVLFLVPKYLSTTFDSTRYMSIPFMTQVSAELSEHSLSLPFFFYGIGSFASISINWFPIPLICLNQSLRNMQVRIFFTYIKNYFHSAYACQSYSCDLGRLRADNC
jgi:hypothetical protein